MHTFKNNSTCQEGSVIVIVMIFLALLTILGISATSMSTTELKIASNDANYKKAFFHAESGVYGVAKWIHQVNDDEAIPAAGTDNSFSYLDEDAEGNEDLDRLLDEVMGYSSAYDDDMDIQFTMASPKYDSTVTVNFDRRRAVLLEGGTAASLGEGASSVGSGPIFGLPYWITSVASRPSSASAAISGRYLKIGGIVGGL